MSRMIASVYLQTRPEKTRRPRWTDEQALSHFWLLRVAPRAFAPQLAGICSSARDADVCRKTGSRWRGVRPARRERRQVYCRSRRDQPHRRQTRWEQVLARGRGQRATSLTQKLRRLGALRPRGWAMQKPSGASFGSLIAGQENTKSGPYTSVSGGRNNTALGNFASVSGGSSGLASNHYATVSGGPSRSAASPDSWRAGGLFQSNKLIPTR